MIISLLGSRWPAWLQTVLAIGFIVPGDAFMLDGLSRYRSMGQRPANSIPTAAACVRRAHQHANVAPNVFNRPYTVTAEVEIPEEGAEGILMSFGGNDAGIAFYVENGKLCFVHNYVAVDYFYVKSDEDVPTGHQFLSYEVEITGEPDVPAGKGSPSKVRLFVGDRQIGEGDLPVTTPIMYGFGGAFVIGADPGSPVAPDWAPPYEFSGTIKRVRFDVTGEPFEDLARRFKAMMARQ